MSALDTYQEIAVTTQSQGKLIVMLYDGAIKFLRMAIRCIEENDAEGKGKYISKAIDIIFELNTVLDMEVGGEVATNLRSLYHFMGRHLSEANIKQDTAMIKEVINLLDELNQSWKAIT